VANGPTISSPCNSKLGDKIHSWSIAVNPWTCPGATPTCRRLCYAQNGLFLMPSVLRCHQTNAAFARTPEFKSWMIRELRALEVKVLRLHVAGDFFDVDYVWKWQEIVAALPRITFFYYTRSWRLYSMRRPLVDLGNMENVRSWWSMDRHTPEVNGLDRNSRIRTAYLAADDKDAAAAPDCDLVFRNDRTIPMKKANGVLVCPAENGVHGLVPHTCSSCKLCWRRENDRRT